ncbi:MAG: glycosyltransferase family 2 protein [Acidobacteriota bacterium]
MNLADNISNLPFVSVIMPVRNEAEFIECGLRAIFAQTYPSDLLEIIIADGESTDETRSIIESLGNETEIPIKIVNNPKRIAPTGLNLAVSNAEGEIIVRVDGHCEIEPEYVANCVKYLQLGKAEGVGGPIETVGETTSAQAIAIAMSSTFGVGGSAFRTIDDREMYVDTVAFPGYKKETLEKVGAFNEELIRNQDDEYNYRLRKAGGRMLLAPDIRSRYYSRSTFKSLWRQYFQYGYWKVRVMQMHPKQMSLRQFIPFCFVSAIIVFGILGIFFGIARWTLFIILGLYIMANLAATIKAVQKTKITALPYIFVSFAILHISYGLGFILGLFAFRNRWRENKNNTVAEAKF